VMHADVRVGQVVEPAQHLFEIIDLSRVWIEVALLERDCQRVQTGNRLDVTFQGHAIRTEVHARGMALTADTREGTAWAEVDNPAGGLLPGMYSQANLVVSSTAVTSVPAAAIVHDGAERYVLVRSGPGQYQRKNIVIGRQVDGFIEVRGGQVYDGDEVVTVGTQ